MAEVPGDNQSFPQGDDLQSQLSGRHRTGTLWRTLFLAATALAIIVLIVLLLTIINQSFGLTAVENTVSPDALVLAYQEERLLAAANTTSSEDDRELVEGLAGDSLAIGFFGYAYYQQNADRLQTLAVDGVTPTAESADSGDYPLTRPLFIYTTAEIMRQKPQVLGLVGYYLNHVDEEIDDVGYFAPTEETIEAARATIAGALGESDFPAVDPAALSGDIAIAGSSTIYPLTLRLVERFTDDGFSGAVSIENIGSTAGIRAFCVDETADMVNASRPMTRLEIEACRANGRQPIAIEVGTDALVVAVGWENDFISDVSLAELQQLFTTAGTWSEVNESWPAEPIKRFIPGQDSGTLDFFAETVFDAELADLPKEDLVAILAASISRGLGRRLERDQRFFEDRLVFEDPALWQEVCASGEPPAGCTLPARSQDNIFILVQERVVVPTVVESWFLFESLFNRGEIALEASEKYPAAEVEFRSWVSADFLTTPQSSKPELAGVRTAILGSLWVIAFTILIAFPIGVGAAIYLEEYANRERWYNRIIQTNINNLAGVPSIIYGMLGLAIFVRALESVTSGVAFGLVEDPTTANGRTILSAGLTLALLVLPMIIINAQEAIRAVPSSLRQASYGIGATRWQTIWSHVLPNAIPGILTGTILAMSRAIGETAPLVVVGASTFITTDPTGPFSKFTVLPIQIYQWTTRPQGVFRNIAGAAIVVLVALLLALNATAIMLRNRASKRMV
jgi:phosphate transport system permease protein